MNPPGAGTMISLSDDCPGQYMFNGPVRGDLAQHICIRQAKVGIQQDDTPPGLCHGNREIHREVALADPALSRRDGNRLGTPSHRVPWSRFLTEHFHERLAADSTACR